VKLDGLLLKSFFAGSETFFEKSKARFRRFQNPPFGLKQLKSLFFQSPRFMNKKSFKERSKRFSFGQQPVELLIKKDCE
jgi:hypothetical protein